MLSIVYVHVSGIITIMQLRDDTHDMIRVIDENPSQHPPGP